MKFRLGTKFILDEFMSLRSRTATFAGQRERGFLLIAAVVLIVVGAVIASGLAFLAVGAGQSSSSHLKRCSSRTPGSSARCTVSINRVPPARR
jgi:hypothetical protein